MNYPVDYLRPEERCEFQVSEKRKKIWAVLIDMVSEIDKICKKYNLTYFAANGTLLGAVRHKGFIPWDDDLDIVMPRPDYDKLIAISEKEIKHPYYLHFSKGNENYFRNYIRFRNEETTAIPMIDLNHNCSKGIFIDIFPLDGCCENNSVQKYRFFKGKVLNGILMNYVYINDINNHMFLRRIAYVMTNLYYKIFGYQSLITLMEDIRRKNSFYDSSKIQAITHDYDPVVSPKDYYADSIWMDFEYIKIPVPKGYDAILTEIYGDYMQFPPIEKRGKRHEIFFDPDHSYLYYEGKLSKKEVADKLNEY